MFVFAVNILVLPRDSDTAALGVNQPGCEFCRIKPQPTLSEMETLNRLGCESQSNMPVLPGIASENGSVGQGKYPSRALCLTAPAPFVLVLRNAAVRGLNLRMHQHSLSEQPR